MEKLQQNIAAQIELGKRKGYILVCMCMLTGNDRQ